MGNRAIVRFIDETGKNGVEVYLHWHADRVADWLKAAAPRMRKSDSGYAAARFIGHCHEQIDGGLSLGVYPLYSCCDGLIYAVNCATGKVNGTQGARGFTVKFGEF